MVGIVEGRKTFANTFKYLQMALSSNFGNMFSMPVASLIFPFLPMTAPQILLNNFLYDSSQLAIPFDNVDEEFLVRPKKFNIAFLKKFMIIFGPLSSCFDFATFAFLALVLHASGGAFQTGWFLESIATQTLVVNLIRSRSDFWKGKGPSAALFLSTFGAVVVAWFLPYTWLGQRMGFVGSGHLSAPRHRGHRPCLPDRGGICQEIFLSEIRQSHRAVGRKNIIWRSKKPAFAGFFGERQ